MTQELLSNDTPGLSASDEPNPSLSNMRRCGFALVDERANFERAL